MPSVIITTQLISSAFSYIPSIIDEISLFSNNTSYSHTDKYIHPGALRYGTDIFPQNFTEIEKETFISLEDYYWFL
jgi:hypothetical protein